MEFNATCRHHACPCPAASCSSTPAWSSTASAWRCRSAPALGLDPWDVFHQGVSDKTGLSFGTIVIITGALVLLAWIPLRQKPGIGTVSNVFVLGIAVDATLALILGDVHGFGYQLALLAAGVVLNAIAGAAYIGAGLGPGAARRPDDRLRAHAPARRSA